MSVHPPAGVVQGPVKVRKPTTSALPSPNVTSGPPMPHRRPVDLFTCPQARAGAFLMFAVVAALAIKNSDLAWAYQWLITMPVIVQVGPLELAKPLLLWVNDGLMAVFFFLIGLEVKREVLAGELSSPRRMALPAFAAAGGMGAPALIYAAINWGDPAALQGWAVPVATDIALALGVLSLAGPRVPSGLKVLLLSLAILDDIGAIIIIAVFYAQGLSLAALSLAAIGLAVAVTLNRCGVVRASPYVLLGIFTWVCVLESGVHATLAGVLIALTVPLRARDGSDGPLKGMEHALHPWVMWLIMPLFAFMNAGVPLSGIGEGLLFAPIPLGILVGLIIGNQIGVPAMVALGVRLGLARLPPGVGWRHIWGLGLLCGVGFTMSLFIGTLAFEDADPILGQQVRLAVLLGSLLSGVAGWAVLRFWAGRPGRPSV
jgi:Na+:H+ antiporter, NhaA family